jgi:hypothetical protein
VPVAIHAQMRNPREACGPQRSGYVVRDANGRALAYLYSRDNLTEALQAKMLTKDEARRIAVNIARALLGRQGSPIRNAIKAPCVRPPNGREFAASQ